ncbi:hypothetical protein Agabi119p4_7584 [Agaricus bisporus var. burnettii]|uniref:Uncharacterized protein n=1 Tax=Agaricus bisporus var. burnettii TaxID=192524 RepID=A0A8H7C7J3_AGABI|nr:hypothetical protein Agabi119p4_7584 [Agaricus bisporus var. burnettii]
MVTTRGQSKGEPTSEPTPTHKRGRRLKSEPKKKAEATPKNSEIKTEGEEKSTVHKKDEKGKEDEEAAEEPPSKRQRVGGRDVPDVYKQGVIERGHIYFFYRPRVQLEEAHSLDEVRNFHMLLIPRPPEFMTAAETAQGSTGIKGKADPEKEEEAEMKVLEPGADAVPSSAPLEQAKQKYRLITIGKKRLPDPEKIGARGGRHKEVFWGTVTAQGDNLDELRSVFGPKEYSTKTRGVRHEAACRLAGRGAYAIVNGAAPTPSKRVTHLGYHLSHPPPEEMGEVQSDLGIAIASSFVVQVKNPLAPATGPQAPRGKGADYPERLMHDVFGSAEGGDKEPTRGREGYGLRFASCETIELMDFTHAQLLMIAAKPGEEGLEESLGEGRGEALSKLEEEESKESIQRVFQELGEEVKNRPAEALEGQWI